MQEKEGLSRMLSVKKERGGTVGRNREAECLIARCSFPSKAVACCSATAWQATMQTHQVLPVSIMGMSSTHASIM